MSTQKVAATSSFMDTLNTPVVSLGVPLAAVAGVGFYFYKQTSSLNKRVSDLEQENKVLRDLIVKQKEQIDMVVSQFQQAFGTIQSQVQNITQPRYVASKPPPSYSPDEDMEGEEIPKEVKKKAKAQPNQSLKDQADAMMRERGAQ